MATQPTGIDIVGVAIPFDRALSGPVNIDVTVTFPDLVGGQTYVYPSLYGQILGAGLDESEQLINEDASQGGTLSLAQGTTAFRFWLSYDGLPGPTGVLARDEIGHAVLTIVPSQTDLLPNLGTRSYDLRLKSKTTRVTIPQGLVFENLLNGGIVSPIVRTETKRYDQGDGTSILWAVVTLTEPPEFDFVVGRAGYTDMRSSGASSINSQTVNLGIALNKNVQSLSSNEASLIKVKNSDGSYSSLSQSVTGSFPGVFARVAAAGSSEVHFYAVVSNSVIDPLLADTGRDGKIYDFMTVLLTQRVTGSNNLPRRNQRIQRYFRLEATFSGTIEQPPWI